MLIGSEVSCSNSAIARKAGWKRLTTFQSSCAEKKSIITLCSGFCVEMLWGDKRSPLGEGGQTETDLLYLLKQRHKWKVDLRSLEIIKTSSWCQPTFFYWQDGKEHIVNIHTFMFFILRCMPVFLLLKLCKQQSLMGSCFWACLQIWSDTLFQHKSCAVLCFCQTKRDYHRDLLYQSFQMISMKTGIWKGLNFCITFTLKREVLYRGQDSWTTGVRTKWAKNHKVDHKGGQNDFIGAQSQWK